MVTFMARRLLLAVFTTIAISILSFLIIHLPPGDYVTTYIAQIASSGGTVSAEEAANLLFMLVHPSPHGNGPRHVFPQV